MITNSSASVISNNLYDLFGVKRYEQGSAETPWRWRLAGEEGFIWMHRGAYLPHTTAALNPCQLMPFPVPVPTPSDPAKECESQLQHCRLIAQGFLAACLFICGVIVSRGPDVCLPVCLAAAPPPIKPFCNAICHVATLGVGVLCGIGCHAAYRWMLNDCQRQYEECMKRARMPRLPVVPAQPTLQ